jgi:hypothetical protein
VAGYEETDPGDQGRRIDQDFNREEWRFKAKMISSEVKDRIVEYCVMYDLTQACKLALIAIVHVAFDPNAMLARNTSTYIRTLQLRITLNLAKVGYAESDIQNAGLMHIEQLILDAFADFVSPSIGGKERDRITKQESITHQSYEGLPNSGQPLPKRGFKLPWSKEE